MLKVLLAATLRKYVPGYDPALGCPLEVEAGTTVAEVADLLGTPRAEVKLIMVEGVAATWETALQGHERVAFFPRSAAAEVFLADVGLAGFSRTEQHAGFQD